MTTGKQKKRKKRVPIWKGVLAKTEIKDDLDHLPDFIKSKLEKPDYQTHFIENNAVTQTLGIKQKREELEQERKKWLDYCASQKRKEDPIEKYCYEIREEMPDYELSYEEYQKEVNKRRKERQEILNKENQAPTDKRSRQLQREEAKQERLDFRLEENSPFHIFLDRVEKISCRCKAEAMRQGIYCDTCRLIVKINEYMLKIFKDSAQGRR
jgi:hypothetical protein